MDFFFVNTAYASLDTFLANANRLIINPIIYLLFAIALVYFLYGMVEFIAGADNEEKRMTGKSHMLWGIIGLGIMLGVWSILQIVINTLGIEKIDPKNQKVELNDYNPKFPPSK